MSDDPPYSGRPRRTRSSVANSSTPKTVTPNPYKKPTYLVGQGIRAPEDSAEDSAPESTKSSGRKSTPARGGRRGRGRGVAGGSRSTRNSVQSEDPPSPASPASGKTPRGRARGRGSRGGGKRATPSSTPTSWTGKSRPECVATRTDRRSTGGGKSKKKRRGFNSQDYHYGSDFESDQNESEPEPAPSDSGESDEEVENEREIPMDETLLLESDSDISGETSGRQRFPSPPVPIWLEPDKEVEELEIPRSSDDLLLTRELVMEAVSIYEPLRRFSNLVRLKPFRFEDFCAALASEEQSPLLVEIHVQLLKSLLREDESNGTVYGPNECKDSIQSLIFFMDNLTWAESFRAYVESDPAWSDILNIFNSVEYPFCGASVRTKILNWLVDAFLLNNNVRDSLTNEGNILHEDHCRACNRLGELICCETCPAVYHLACINSSPSAVPPTDDWICPICESHAKTGGISDCTSELEKAGLLLRHEKLGYDRHGRQYWFLVRRILVESEDRKEVWYYSSRLQVEELIHRLDAENFESVLVENILYYKDEIYRQMGITETVTAAMNVQHRKTYLEAENAFLLRIHTERELIKEQEAAEKMRLEEEARLAKKKEEEEKLRLEEEERKRKEDEKRKIREERLAKRNQIKAKKRMGYVEDSMDVLDGSLLNDESKDSFYDHEETVETEERSAKQAGDSNDESLSEQLTQPLENGDVQEEEMPDAEAETQIIGNNEAETQIIGNDEAETERVCNTHEETQRIASGEDVNEVEIKTDREDTEAPSNGLNEKEAVGKVEPKAEVKPDPPPTPSILPKIFAKSKSLNLEVDSEERMTRLKSTGLYKLGQEGGYRTYVNSYSSDPLALSKTQHVEERDKRRQMSHKFSLTPASDCKWIGVQHGYRTSLVGTLRATLLHMENTIPTTLMHCNWGLLRKAWMTAVNGCANSSEFSKALTALAACLRPCVFNPIWSEATGHVKLLRTGANEREHRKKIEKRDKKDRDDEEDRLRLLAQFVKYSIPPKHQVWKQKGEEFRLHGRWGWIWLSTLRPSKPKDCRKMGLLGGPHKHVVQVKSVEGKVKTLLIDPDAYNKLMAKRTVIPEQKKPAPEAKPSEPSSSSAQSTESKDEEKMEIEVSVEGETAQPKPEQPAVVEGETALPKPEQPAVVEGESTQAPPKVETSEVTPNPTQTTAVDKPVGPKEEPMEMTVTKIKEETNETAKPPEPKADEPKPKNAPPTPDSNPLSAASKFRTPLINVSMSLTTANRILYPKIAHKQIILDSLLPRRLKWMAQEEKTLVDEFGTEVIEASKAPSKELPRIKVELDDSFPLAGGYAYTCYSHECQAEARANNPNYEARCYSPMCRLKFVMLDARRRKLERDRQVEIDKQNKVHEKIEAKKIYTKSGSSGKIYLKKLVDPAERKRELIQYPLCSKFCSIPSKKPSILILPRHELKKLSRTAGRITTPAGYTVNSKPNSWIWPYPCGRPYFKTSWQYRTVHAVGLSAAAMQLRVLYASVRWDDILMKPPNLEGKSQITTDMEIITSEILNHRVVGRFEEIYQYLRRRHIVPIDAPKTIREVTPSRSGLRKRKRAESPDKMEPTISEEWVDEDKFEVWEIRFYGDKLERKLEKKPETTPLASTRTKSGIALKQPDKWDPSPKEPPPRPTPPPNIDPKKVDIQIHVETEVKMQRAVHLSKRDNHAKTNNNNQNKVPTPTASQQLLKQNAAAATATPPPTKTFIHLGASGNPSGKKFFLTKPSVTVGARPPVPQPAETASPGILARKSSPMVLAKSLTGTVQQLTITPGSSTQQLSNQKLQVFRTADGKLQVKGLLSGQHAYQTQDGKVHVIAAPAGVTLPSQSKVLTQLNSSKSVTTSAGISGYGNPIAVITQTYANPRPPAPVPTVAVSQPLVNISNPAIKTVISTTVSAGTQPAPLNTYTPSPRARKAPVRAVVPPPPPTGKPPPPPPEAVASPQIVHIGLTAAQLIASNVPIRIQTGKGLFEITGDQIVTTPTGQHQIILGHGLPIIGLGPSPVQPPRPALVPSTGTAPQPTPPQPMPPQPAPPPPPVAAPSASTPPALTTPQSGGGKQQIVYSDGVKNYVLSTQGMTQAQANAFALQLQQNKIVFKTGTGEQVVPVNPGTQATSLQTQYIQVIQQGGKTVNVVPSPVIKTEPVSSPQVPSTPAVQQAQVPAQTPPRPQQQQFQMGAQEIATIGGQKVVVNRIIPTTAAGSTPVGLQKLVTGTGMSATKTLIRVDGPKYTGSLPSVRPSGPSTSTHVPPTVTKTPGLPISIVSPSKPKVVIQAPTPGPPVQQRANNQPPPLTQGSVGKIVTSQQLSALLQQQQRQQQAQTLSGQSSSGQRQQLQTITTSTGQQLQTITTSTGQQLQTITTSTGQQLQTITTSTGQQLQIIRTEQGHMLRVTTEPPKGNAVSLAGQTIRLLPPSSVQTAPKVTTQQPVIIRKTGGFPGGSVIPSAILPTTLLRQQQQLMGAVSAESPAPTPPTTSTTPPQIKPTELTAQIYQSAQGPKIIVQGLPTNLNPTQLAHLQAQLTKQLSGGATAGKGCVIFPSAEPVGRSPVAAGVAARPAPPGTSSVHLQQQPRTTPSIVRRASASKPPVPKPKPVTPARPQAELHRSDEKSIVESIEAVIGLSSGAPEERKLLPAASEERKLSPGAPEERKLSITAPVIHNIRFPAQPLPQPLPQPVPQLLPQPQLAPVKRPVPAAEKSGRVSPKKRKVSGPGFIPVTVAGGSHGLPSPSPVAAIPPPQAPPAQPVPKPVLMTEAPRFVLSQDLVESPAPSVPTTTPDTLLSTISTDPDALSWTSPISVAETVTIPSTGSGTGKASRRKSPVRDAALSPGKSSSVVTSPKAMTAMYKHKELLKKDIMKKRLLMEKDFTVELQVGPAGSELLTEPAYPELQVGSASSELLPDTEPANPVLTTQEEIAEELIMHGSPAHMEVVTDSALPTSSQSQKKRKSSESQGPKRKAPPKGKPTRKSAPRKGAGKKGKKEKDEETLYCICHTPYDESKFYVGCDVCSNWFHGECIGITEQLSRCLSDYLCEACQKEKDRKELEGSDKPAVIKKEGVDKKEKKGREVEAAAEEERELYCLCAQPYDEAQFYIACDSCEDWFHGRCVGILQVEADEIPVYTCPKCDPRTPLNIANLQPICFSEYPQINKLLKQIQTHKSAWPFLEPVDTSEAPNYYKVIKEPMDLQTVEVRTESSNYVRLRDFIGDITKIFDNCRFYNPPESPFFKSAEILEAFFAQKIKLIRKRLIDAHSQQQQEMAAI